MAKNKSKKKSGKSQQPKLTPQRYIKERARKLPIGRCFVNEKWQEEGLAQVIVTRNRADGNLVLGVYLVDTYCLGVKDAFINNDISDYKLKELLDKLCPAGDRIIEVPYAQVHNLIYGALEFAEDAGIPPVKDFALARYVLEEDTDDIPLIEYEYGKDGKYMLICGQNERDKLFIAPLQKRLGDKFDFIAPINDEEDEEIPEHLLELYDEMDRHPEEKYSYTHPTYPATLEVKNQFIADEFYNPANYSSMPDSVIAKILALPADEAAQDISNIIMYEIGRTYKAIEECREDELDHGALLHAIFFLAHINSNKALDAILEIMKQTIDFADYHFGDLAPEYIFRALYMAGKNNVDVIEKYIYEPGYSHYLRDQAVYALAMIAENHPERRDEIIDIFRHLLNSLVERLPRQEACDGAFAGFTMSALIDLGAKALIPEIKKVFATDCVDKTIAGDCYEVIKNISDPDFPYVDHRKPEPIEESYRRLKSIEQPDNFK